MRFPFPRRAAIALCVSLGCMTPVMAEVSVTYSIPGVSFGLNLGGYPVLQRIPGYPVYYAPRLDRNYFFYDGLYWVLEDDTWYTSSWYNGPWGRVDPFYVPDYLLRVPVRYYRRAPAYFRGWRADAPPRWDEHWGRSWYERRQDWDRWDRRSSPAAAPLPSYQRNYRGDRYPGPSAQGDLHIRNYRYQPREAVSREHFRERRQEAESSRARREAGAREQRQRQQPDQRQERRDKEVPYRPQGSPKDYSGG